MDQGNLTHGKYTIDIAPNGCVVSVIDEDQKIPLCGGIQDPELAMTIVEGLILVEAKRFYKPDAERVVTTQTGKPIPHLLKKD